METRWVRSNRPALFTMLFVSIAVLATPLLAEAHITRIDIIRVESPTFEGTSFGEVGPYEKLVGRAFGEVDPRDPRNAVIADINLAPRNARGMVEYSTDVYILRPVDRSKGNHRIFFEINNRGNNFSFGLLNNASAAVVNDPTTAVEVGNGFLMRQGYTIVLSGWDAGVAPGGGRQTISVPVARNRDGSSIVGPALEELVIDNATTMTGILTYAAATLDKFQASLSVRARYADPPTSVPATDWEYVNASYHSATARRDTVQARAHCTSSRIRRGIRSSRAWALRPLVISQPTCVGRCGTAPATPPRWLKAQVTSTHSAFRSPAASCTTSSTWASTKTSGASASSTGCSTGSAGAVGASSTIGSPSPAGPTGSISGAGIPSASSPSRIRSSSIRSRGRPTAASAGAGPATRAPEIFEANSANEYWVKAGSLLHTDTRGNDLRDPRNVRFYLFSSLPHSAGIGPTGPGICQQPRNPVVANPGLRALLVALDEWVSDG